MPPRDVILALCPPLLWAVAYTLAKPAVMHFPPIFMMAIVYALAALLLYRPSRLFRTPWWALVTIATFGGAIQSSMIFIGLAGLPASTAILVVQTQVPFAVLGAWAIGREPLNFWRALGIAVAFSGIALIAGAPESANALLPLFLVIFGTLSWGIAQALIRLIGRDDGRATIAGISVIATPQLLILSLLLEHDQTAAVLTARPIDWCGVLLLSVGGLAIAYSIWYNLLQRYRVDQVAPFALLMPPLGVAASFLLLDERVSLLTALGGLILLGLAIVVRVPSPNRPPAIGDS